MSHTVIKYFIYFKNSSDRIYIPEEERAIKLQKLLMSKDCPKFFDFNGSIYAVSSIDRVIKESEFYQN